MSTTWIGLIAGGVIGGALGYAASKKFGGHGDLGVTVAALGAGALIGGALMAPKPQDQTQEQASQTPTPATTP